MFIKRQEAEKKILEYLNERDQQAGEPERQILNPAIAKLILDGIQNIRAIEVRPKGRWIRHDLTNSLWQVCSRCDAHREYFGFYERFCPVCGSQMEGGEE